MPKQRLIPLWLFILVFAGALACNPVAFFAGNAEENGTTPQAGIPRSTEPSNAPTETVVQGRMGQRVAAEGVAITVDKAELSTAVTQPAPEEGRTFLLVHLRIENTDTTQELDVGPGDLQVRAGTTEPINFTPIDSLSDQLNDTQLPPQDVLAGTAGFLVDKQAHGWHLLYDFNDQHVDIDLGF